MKTLWEFGEVGHEFGTEIVPVGEVGGEASYSVLVLGIVMESGRRPGRGAGGGAGWWSASSPASSS